MRMFSIIALAAASLMLPACSLGAAASGPINLIPPPAAVADQTVLDEKIAIGVELAYQAAVLTVSTATKAGLVKGATAEKLLDADRAAYQAVLTVRAAYDAGNATSYADAATAAYTAIRSIISIIAG